MRVVLVEFVFFFFVFLAPSSDMVAVLCLGFLVRHPVFKRRRCLEIVVRRPITKKILLAQ